MVAHIFVVKIATGATRERVQIDTVAIFLKKTVVFGYQEPWENHQVGNADHQLYHPRALVEQTLERAAPNKYEYT